MYLSNLLRLSDFYSATNVFSIKIFYFFYRLTNDLLCRFHRKTTIIFLRLEGAHG